MVPPKPDEKFPVTGNKTPLLVKAEVIFAKGDTGSEPSIFNVKKPSAINTAAMAFWIIPIPVLKSLTAAVQTSSPFTANGSFPEART